MFAYRTIYYLFFSVNLRAMLRSMMSFGVCVSYLIWRNCWVWFIFLFAVFFSWGSRGYKYRRLFIFRYRICCFVRIGEWVAGWNFGCGKVVDGDSKWFSFVKVYSFFGQKMTVKILFFFFFYCVWEDVAGNCRDRWMLSGWFCQ